eukprot:CAMPEP_0184351052 /NCGR_PEP_ID=MMETSP1089-20130417/43354_1 /TAXON_ID=38269 ORGANISM="Gloeochaete wittrockiana, Strain SAG46.84" /NCGR_SAMPLE_ID=MMETSP1089 /ASSEMBLY_ACC=CAM_ASM_000445 /LENGTH=192 /DNA_ID=CAMNT_0026684251 /DNA_START=293 /DNA_END=867 /DNA_ORIENTATION=-
MSDPQASPPAIRTAPEEATQPEDSEIDDSRMEQLLGVFKNNEEDKWIKFVAFSRGWPMIQEEFFEYLVASYSKLEVGTDKRQWLERLEFRLREIVRTLRDADGLLTKYVAYDVNRRDEFVAMYLDQLTPDFFVNARAHITKLEDEEEQKAMEGDLGSLWNIAQSMAGREGKDIVINPALGVAPFEIPEGYQP